MMEHFKLPTIIQGFKTLAEKYDFNFYENKEEVGIKALTRDNVFFQWIWFDKQTEIFYYWNTDHINLWLCDTRKDFTPEKCIAFVKDVNKFVGADFKVQNLIDPEDWQEIAQVYDAYEDKRYTEN